jgi:hypothetical protein
MQCWEHYAVWSSRLDCDDGLRSSVRVGGVCRVWLCEKTQKKGSIYASAVQAVSPFRFSSVYRSSCGWPDLSLKLEAVGQTRTSP